MAAGIRWAACFLVYMKTRTGRLNFGPIRVSFMKLNGKHGLECIIALEASVISGIFQVLMRRILFSDPILEDLAQFAKGNGYLGAADGVGPQLILLEL